MDEQHEIDSALISALMEANEMLGEDNDRLRNLNRILRKVNSFLREQIANAHASDEEFRTFCQQEVLIDETVASVEKDGLSESIE